MQSITLLEAYKQFSETEACRFNPKLLGNLRTTLRRYVLPRYKDFSAGDLRTDLDSCLATVSLTQLLTDAPQILQALEKGVVSSSNRTVSNGTISNYRSVLLRFFNWMYTQDWKTSVKSSCVPKFAPSVYNGQTGSKAQRTNRQPKNSPYALKEKELTTELREQLEQLDNFLTGSRFPDGEDRGLLTSTFKFYKDNILCILGWQRKIKRKLLTELSLSQVADFEQLKTFITWGIQDRGNGTGWAINITGTAIAVAKWLASREQLGYWSFALQELQDYRRVLTNEYFSAINRESQNGDGELLTFDESVEVVNYLKQCCAPYSKSGVLRSESAIMRSWQRYLIVALLIYLPLRQREIIKLEPQQSLFREPNGYWIRFSSNLKNSETVPRRQFLLPSHLTGDLDEWMQNLRPKIKTDHALVFIRTGSGRVPKSLGQPLSDRDISDLVSTAVYKATSALFGTPKRIKLQTLQPTTLVYLGSFRADEAINDALRATDALRSAYPPLVTIDEIL